MILIVVILIGMFLIGATLIYSGYLFGVSQFSSNETGEFIELPKGKKLLTCTVQWKGIHLWYMTEDAESGYTPKTYTFRKAGSEEKIVFQENS